MTRERIALIEAENVSYRKIFERLNDLIAGFEAGEYRTAALMLDALQGEQEEWEALRAKYDLLLERETDPQKQRHPRPGRS